MSAQRSMRPPGRRPVRYSPGARQSLKPDSWPRSKSWRHSASSAAFSSSPSKPALVQRAAFAIVARPAELGGASYCHHACGRRPGAPGNTPSKRSRWSCQAARRASALANCRGSPIGPPAKPEVELLIWPLDAAAMRPANVRPIGRHRASRSAGRSACMASTFSPSRSKVPNNETARPPARPPTPGAASARCGRGRWHRPH